jgi:hypothetical protein
MKNLIKSFVFIALLAVVHFKPTEAKSQGAFCESYGITEKETNIVYCIGMGYTTCIIPCPEF